jgi:hypothetical protein
MTQTQLAEAPDTVKWYHHLLSLPLRAFSALNMGPLGGENSISAVIEAVLAKQKGQPVDFQLSKTDQFFAAQLTNRGVPDEMIEYRELSHEAQREILRRWGGRRLGVIWLGAGVFTLEHPLLAERKPTDWHVWTDASPKVVADALKLFQAFQQQNELGNLAQNITLPQEVGPLNHIIQFIAAQVDHIIILGYGVTYALTVAENYQWLSRLDLPANIDVSFVFNSPGAAMPILPGVMASFHQQRMVYYTDEHVIALFHNALPHSEIVWQRPRKETRNKLWGTWLIHRPAQAQ